MLLGLMNNPARDPLKEIARIADNGFDFVDLTLEPPGARADQINPAKIRAALQARNLSVVGHTAYYLPFASPFDAVQAGAVAEAERCLPVFAHVGARLMNLHLDCRAPGHDTAYITKRNVEAIERLLPAAQQLGIRLMIENADGDTADTLAPVLDALPAHLVGLHLDVGHANIRTSRASNTASLLGRYADRLLHVHFSDNKGKGDDHLAIGAGAIDWRREIKALQAVGYNGTITLECFYGDADLIAYSRD
jgi:sugar phosphate isomerase/epimerase